MIRDERDQTNYPDDERAAPRDARPQERAHDGKEGGVRREGEHESDRNLVLRLVLLKRAGRGVPREEVHGEVHDEREEEEGEADQAR